jgi:hypothetical protein
MVREKRFTLLACSESATEATDWRERWLDSRVCRRREKPWMSGYRLLRAIMARNGAERSRGILW